MKKKDQNIKCNVDSCKYNDCSDNKCNLSEIKIGCNCGDVQCKEDTICDSYKEKKE